MSDYLEAVAGLGCVVCRRMGLGYAAAEVHHVESIRDSKSDYATVPLCPDHHRGPNGVHGLSRRGFETRYKLSDVDLLALTAEAMWKR